MTPAFETAPIIIDRQSSEPGKPFGIITVDCSSPYEFDDGLAVTRLDSAKEAYQVQVFAADTSRLYMDEDITKNVISASESLYYDDAQGEKQYEPMLDVDLIKNRHFVKGTLRNALVCSFKVGDGMPPQDVQIDFGQVDVRENYNYKEFAIKAKKRRPYFDYARAAAFITMHLRPDAEAGYASYKNLFDDPKYPGWGRGSALNQTYMISTNHLVGKQLVAEDHLAIYRNFEPDDDTFSDILGPKIALFSTHAGFHDGIKLGSYCRVTSPLRRAEDFVMHGLLKARVQGRELNTRDHKLVAATVQRLNQRTIANIYKGELRLQEDDLWAHRPQYPQIVPN